MDYIIDRSDSLRVRWLLHALDDRHNRPELRYGSVEKYMGLPALVTTDNHRMHVIWGESFGKPGDLLIKPDTHLDDSAVAHRFAQRVLPNLAYHVRLRLYMGDLLKATKRMQVFNQGTMQISAADDHTPRLTLRLWTRGDCGDIETFIDASAPAAVGRLQNLNISVNPRYVRDALRIYPNTKRGRNQIISMHAYICAEGETIDRPLVIGEPLDHMAVIMPLSLHR